MNVSVTALGKTAPRFCILLQFLLKVLLLHPLSKKIAKSTGAIPKRAGAGAVYNMMLYYLISNVSNFVLYANQPLIYVKSINCCSTSDDRNRTTDSEVFLGLTWI